MQTHYGFEPFGREKIVHIGAVVLKEVLGEARGAFGACQDGEGFLLVAVAVGEVGADGFGLGEVFFGCVIEAVGESVALRLAFGCPCFPAACVHPCGTASGGVAVDGYEQDVGRSEGVADGVDAVRAFAERDVGVFGDYGACVIALGGECCHDGVGHAACVLILEESAIGGAFPLGGDAVAVVD